MLRLIHVNITLPYLKMLAWMRLAIFYHNLASISPRPTLVQKQKELDFAYYLSYTLSFMGVLPHAKEKRTHGTVHS